MRARHAFYWIIAVSSIVLLSASLMGDGRGVGFMSHMVWAYVFGIGLLAMIAWAAAGSSKMPDRTRAADGRRQQTRADEADASSSSKGEDR